MEIILASSSPRRQELLRRITNNFKIIVSNADERIDKSLPMDKMVEEISFKKAEAVFKDHEDSLVIGSDTMVFLENEALGKPKDEKDAFRMLRKLSGKTHTVATGVTILKKNLRDSFSVLSKVTFTPLTDSEIISYIKTGEPMDKAGSYGLQGKGALFIEHLDGDFFSVMGLPVCELKKHLEMCGYTCPWDENNI